jgi:hypothetical protein
MAIDTWIIVTLNPAAAKIPDNVDHKNKTSGATADGGSLTLAYDSAVITTQSLAKSCVASALTQLASKLPL